MIIPNTKINLATNIRDVLNGAGGKVGNKTSSFFTLAAKINKWSKYKPVKYREAFPLTEEEYDKLYDDKLYWWKADDGLCGFDWDSIEFDTVDDLIYAHDNGLTYQYELPTGGKTQPYRLGDFRNYNTDARSPIWSFEVSGQMINNQYGTSCQFTVIADAVDTRYNLTYQDITPDDTDFTLSQFFFGIVITDGNKTFVKKHSNVIGDNTEWACTIDVTLQELADRSMANIGELTAYPIFTNGTLKRYIACDIAPVKFQIIRDPAEERVGWMDNTTYCVQHGGKKSFYGTLAWNKVYDYDYAFTFVAYVMRNGERIELTNDNPKRLSYTVSEHDDDVYYSDIVLSASSDTAVGDVFYIEVIYASSGNQTISKIAECPLQDPIEPENVE